MSKTNDPVMVPIDQDANVVDLVKETKNEVNVKEAGDVRRISVASDEVKSADVAEKKTVNVTDGQDSAAKVGAKKPKPVKMAKKSETRTVSVSVLDEDGKEEPAKEAASTKKAKSASTKKAVQVKDGGDAAKNEKAVQKVSGQEKGLAKVSSSEKQLAVVKKDKALPAKMSDVSGGRSTKTSGTKTAGKSGGQGRRKTSGAAMDMMVAAPATKASSAKKAETAPEKTRATKSKAEEKDKKSKKVFAKPLSRPKALGFAALVALIVGAIGAFAIWVTTPKAPQYCLVQFESNGGSLIEDEEVVCGETIDRPEDPTKDGFDFKDWTYDGRSFGFGKTKVDQDMILIAEWEIIEGTEVVKVSFDSDGGSEVKAIELAKGNTTPAPIAPTRDGYTFMGWFLDDVEFTFADPIEEDITLKAKWEKIETPSAEQPSSPSQNTTNDSGSSSQSKPKVASLSASDRTVSGGGFVVEIAVNPSTAEYSLTAVSSDTRVADCQVTRANMLSCSAGMGGTARITVRDTVSGKTTTFNVTVPMAEVPVDSVEIPGGNRTLKAGGTLILSAQITPSNATSKAVTWSSNNASVATVSADGRVTALQAGTAIITATTPSGKSASIEVMVLPKDEPVVPPEEPGDGGEGEGDGGA